MLVTLLTVWLVGVPFTWTTLFILERPDDVSEHLQAIVVSFLWPLFVLLELAYIVFQGMTWSRK